MVPVFQNSLVYIESQGTFFDTPTLPHCQASVKIPNTRVPRALKTVTLIVGKSKLTYH